MNDLCNNSMITKRTLSSNDITITYRLFENNAGGLLFYSALLTMEKDGVQEDRYIPELSSDKISALNIFHIMHKNFVLPSEIDALFSEGMFDTDPSCD